jgi:hypothetical protein
VHKFWAKNLLGHILGDFSQTHLVTLHGGESVKRCPKRGPIHCFVKQALSLKNGSKKNYKCVICNRKLSKLNKSPNGDYSPNLVTPVGTWCNYICSMY